MPAAGRTKPGLGARGGRGGLRSSGTCLGRLPTFHGGLVCLHPVKPGELSWARVGDLDGRSRAGEIGQRLPGCGIRFKSILRLSLRLTGATLFSESLARDGEPLVCGPCKAAS
jgi:hypothetical protein